MKIHEVITKELWQKGDYGAGGIDCPHCSLGWIDAIYGMLDLKAEDRLRKAIECSSIVEWNDDPARTFAEVKDAFRRADL